MKHKSNRKETNKRVRRENERITRDSKIIKDICDKGIKLSCVARIGDASHKRGHDNVLLQHIIFSYEDKEYYIEHCWLQEFDYPAGFYQQVIQDRKYYIEFSFYPYHDAIDRGMHGMKVKYFERY